MSDLTITILRVGCTKPTDSLVEDGTDEVGWRLVAKNAAGDKSMTREGHVLERRPPRPGRHPAKGRRTARRVRR
jgi:hypothetical protein